MTFNTANIVSGLVVFVILVAIMFLCSRHISMKPGKGQNFLEWLIDFTNGILKGSLPNNEVNAFGLYAFVLFAFLFVSNTLGLFIQVSMHGVTLVRSPTSDPIVTLTFSLTTMMIAQFAGVRKLGYKRHFENYLHPFKIWIVMNVFEQFTDFLTLGLRIFGVVFSGEMLLKVIYTDLAAKGGAWLIAAVPLEVIWQGFSVFLGAIQAFVFVTLSTVYIAKGLGEE
ncbi:ATP synthase F0 subunit A [Levilactobacillus bambusae]|uniref:ATP synthase subunit a n=2 Tax=Levilactobacillus bambusae TaxID=2024736 RepID=A0A2V1MZT1_9LACO|nr:ATP synthase F0 subunit A [Levilactobacillus bambusae]